MYHRNTSAIVAYILTATIVGLSMACDSQFYRFATWNLRYDSKPDNITVQQSLDALGDPLIEVSYLNDSSGAETPWSTRRIRVAEVLQSEGVALVGFQEALVRQVDDMFKLFGDGWSYVGVGRDDGVAAGEFSPIFYDKSVFTLKSNDSFWLSNTPFEPSKFPGAGSVRICTVAHFTTIVGNRNFTILNTHLDDQSEDERELAGSMLLYRAKYEAVTRGEPVIVQGDFNSPPTGVDNGAYNIITGVEDPVAMNASFTEKFAVDDNFSFTMLDLRGQTPRRSVSNTFATFTGFTAPNDTSQWTRIDFQFGGSNAGWSSVKYKVMNVLSDDGMLLSDHRPVFSDIVFT